MARVTKPLTNTEIEKAKAKQKPYSLADGGGLFLLVSSTGAKTWQFNYYRPFTNKRTKFSLGAFPDVSLAQARAKREEFRALLAQGVDPQEEAKKEEQAASGEMLNSFLQVAERWKAKKAQEIEPLTLKKNWRRLEVYAFPALGCLPVAEVLPSVVIKSLEPLSQQGKGDTLKRTLRLINEILNYAVNYGLLPFNPCANVNAVFNFGKSEHNPTIRPEELPAFLYQLKNSKLTLYTRCLIKFQLLTMARPVEASSAEWSEIDLLKSLWSIPAEKMKTRKPHIVPLSTQARGVLAIMWQFTAAAKYVFQSARTTNKPMNSQTVNKALVDLGYKGKLTAHGLRSIGSTYLNEYEPMISPDVIEACLSHGIKDQVRRAYNRSDYLEQRRIVMQIWGDYVEACERNFT
ncbi:integrase arm-type DNA-binding domain-containing protein [Avibacterium paragallinarum]|uniref:tyrosine-type recombinase/integrase n=1 Tax=Avibacterium paragallinarum TaxID=728 RepID=UPI0021F7C7CE|nr:integrase arm-type DNA-binding domain-containing protein [Avibacterium paragallinarum]UXN35965.1 integrase arm-type DNA-binding domain-containing protein [Avibacterium paragallinarum]